MKVLLARLWHSQMKLSFLKSWTQNKQQTHLPSFSYSKHDYYLDLQWEGLSCQRTLRSIHTYLANIATSSLSMTLLRQSAFFMTYRKTLKSARQLLTFEKETAVQMRPSGWIHFKLNTTRQRQLNWNT